MPDELVLRRSFRSDRWDVARRRDADQHRCRALGAEQFAESVGVALFVGVGVPVLLSNARLLVVRPRLRATTSRSGLEVAGWCRDGRSKTIYESSFDVNMPGGSPEDGRDRVRFPQAADVIPRPHLAVAHT
jgi:hypothetical protein